KRHKNFSSFLELDGFVHFWKFGRQAMPLLNKAGQSRALVIFAVRQNNPRLGPGDDIEPMHQVRLSGMRTETAERMDLCFDRDLLAKNTDSLFAIYQPSA